MPLTRPMRSASSASTSRPVRIRSFATPRPQTRASRWVPPQPGMIPRLISRLAELRARRRVAEVAGERELAAAAEREALDRGDRRLGHRLQQLRDLVAELAPGRRLLDREAAHVLDVGAGDERLLARAGQHRPHRPRRRRASSCKLVAQLPSSVGRSSAFIASGPVDRDGRDRLVALDDECSDGDLPAQELDDLARRRAGREHGGDALRA